MSNSKGESLAPRTTVPTDQDVAAAFQLYNEGYEAAALAHDEAVASERRSVLLEGLGKDPKRTAFDDYNRIHNTDLALPAEQSDEPVAVNVTPSKRVISKKDVVLVTLIGATLASSLGYLAGSSTGENEPITQPVGTIHVNGPSRYGIKQYSSDVPFYNKDNRSASWGECRQNVTSGAHIREDDDTGTLTVTHDAKRVRITENYTRVVVPKGVKVGSIVVCGIESSLVMKGSAAAATVYGPDATLLISGDVCRATIDGEDTRMAIGKDAHVVSKSWDGEGARILNHSNESAPPAKYC